MRAFRFALYAATAMMILSPLPSFALTINISHNSGCFESFVSSTPISPVTNCALSQNFSGNTVTQTSLMQSRVDHTSFGALHNFSIELDAPFGLSITPPSGVWAQLRSIASEQITITAAGGSGDGILRLAFDVHGISDVSNFLPGASYFISLSIASTANGGIVGPGSSFIDIPFTYGSPFNVSRLLDLLLLAPGSLGGFGHFGPFSASADFLNSADFTFEVLDQQLRPVVGSIITSDDGFIYPQLVAAAVPEPTSSALLAVGLVLVLVSRQRTKARAWRRSISLGFTH